MSPAEVPRLYVVAISHLDTQWRWTVRDVIRKYLPRTLRENFALFEVFPGYVLSFEGAFRYMLAEEYYPRDFERLKSWIAAGRWRVVGSMIDAPDVNLASSESLIRHILYATLYFHRTFGERGNDIFLPDCFGFPFSLPTIATHCGILGFSSQKFGMWMAPAKVPFDVGLWEGPDGSRLAAALEPGGYGERLTEDLSQSRVWHRRLLEKRRRGEPAIGLKYFGVGDRGGSPDEASLFWLTRSISGHGQIEVLHGGSDRIFLDLEDEERGALPVYRGELLLPTHGTGCWTSQAVLKRWNRRAELLADSAERATVIASWLAQFPYPTEEIRNDWIRFLWHQMHDDLTGTSIPSAYEISWNDLALSANRLATLLTDAISAVSRGLDTRSEGASVVLFNPLSFPRRETVQIRVDLAGQQMEFVEVRDPDGNEVRSQIVARDPGGLDIVFDASLPPLGLVVYEIRPADGPCAMPSELSIGDSYLENEHFRIEIDAAGDIGRILDKQHEREVLSASARLELLPDRSSRWPAWEIRYRTLCAEPEMLSGPVERTIVESGPARAALRLTRRFAGSTVQQTIRLSAQETRPLVEVDTEVDWRTRGRLLKVRFPLAAESDLATFDLGCGVIERGMNSAAKHEVPAHQWVDLADRGGEWGVSLLSDSKYGWDRPALNTLRLSLLRSPRTVRKFRHQATQDFGHHRFAYAIYPHSGNWSEADTVACAAGFNQRIIAFQARKHSGALGRSLSLLGLDSDAVTIRALKRAEEGGEFILRMQETAGTDARATVTLGEGIGSAREVNGREEKVGASQVEGGSLHTRLRPFEPKSFALRLSPTNRKIQPLRTTQLKLDFDTQALSFHDRRRSCDFDGEGHSIPGEIFPTEVMSGEIPFRLATRAAEGPHCVSCCGQQVPLPDSGGDSVYLLATAAAADDCPVVFGLGELNVQATVRSWSRPVGAWRRQRVFLGLPWGEPAPGYLVRTPVAWVAGHRHDKRIRDQPYVFCYLFRYCLPRPDGARSITLPHAPAVKLFAATLAQGDGTELVAASDLFF